MGERLVIGVDGGGTKTDICLVTTSGDVVGFVTGGGANWEGAGLEAVGDVLHRLVGQAVAAAGADRSDLAAAAFCLAGVDWPSDHERLSPFLDALGVGGPRRLENDAFAGLRAGAPAGFGCVSIAGTGGVAAGRDRRGRTARTMGIAIGEGAGAWGLVTAALAALAAEVHRSGPTTQLTPRLLAATDAPDVAALFEGLSRGTRLIGGDLSVHVLDAARDGDEVARRISRECGAQHGRDVVGIARQLSLVDEEFDVVMAGGIHLNGEPAFRSGFSTEVLAAAPGARLHTLDAPPAAGAALLALELLEIDGAALHDRVCTGATAARQEITRP